MVTQQDYNFYSKESSNYKLWGKFHWKYLTKATWEVFILQLYKFSDMWNIHAVINDDHLQTIYGAHDETHIK